METNIERRNKILKLRSEGLSYSKIAKELNCTKSLVAFYCGKRYDSEKAAEKEASQLEYEQIVCEAIRTHKNLNQVCKFLGKRAVNNNYKFLNRIIEKYSIDISHFDNTITYTQNIRRYDDKDVFCQNSPLSTSNVKNRLFTLGLKEKRCECCHNTEWNNKPIPLQVHHINGDNTDNRIENLQILCPNCHAQTDNYCGASKMRKENFKKKKEKKSKMPSKENLIQTFKLHRTFVNVGRYYGVSDNAVRKWCIKYNLPVKTKEILKIIDE